MVFLIFQIFISSKSSKFGQNGWFWQNANIFYNLHQIYKYTISEILFFLALVEHT